MPTNRLGAVVVARFATQYFGTDNARGWTGRKPALEELLRLSKRDTAGKRFEWDELVHGIHTNLKLDVVVKIWVCKRRF
jgi:hypothetical protein